METDAVPFVSENTFRVNPSPTQSGNLHLFTDIIKKIQDYSTFYDLHDHQKRIAVVFNQYEFDDILNLTQRLETNNDCARIIALLKKLEFQVTAIQDPTLLDIDEQIRKVARMKKVEVSCVVVVVMTHGGADGRLYAQDTEYIDSEIWVPFTMVPALIDVPKLFIIQACRENAVNPGYQIADENECDGTDFNGYTQLPGMTNMLWMYSTFEDSASWRNNNGTWFIQTLCDILDKDGTQLDILQIINQVNNKMGGNLNKKNSKKIETHDKKQMPQIYSTLTKTLSFKLFNE